MNLFVLFKIRTRRSVEENAVKNQQSGKADLNRRPLGPEPSALPPALLPVRRFFRREKNTHSLEWVVTGATGLEPAISGVTGQRDNQLRYAPVI